MRVGMRERPFAPFLYSRGFRLALMHHDAAGDVEGGGGGGEGATSSQKATSSTKRPQARKRIKRGMRECALKPSYTSD